MKKFLAIAMSLAMLLGLLSGCTGQSPAPTTQAEPEIEEVFIPDEMVTEVRATEVATEAPTEAPVEKVTVRIGALTGPTAMGMVKLFQDADAGLTANDYTRTLGGIADELRGQFLQGDLDLFSAPANLAATLYNKTEGGVKVIAVNVLGVLYIGEYNSDEIHSVADLKGKTIMASGKGSTPEYFLRHVLTGNGLDPDTDVTMDWKEEASEVVANMADGSIVMLPQPYVTAAGIQLGEGFHTCLSLSDEWEALGDDSLCTTAVIMARAEFADAHPEAIDAFLAEFAESAQWVNENVAEAAALCGEYEIIKTPVAQKAIPYCNITCLTGNAMKDALSGCLQVIFDQNPKAVGGSMPADDFYYGAYGMHYAF